MMPAVSKLALHDNPIDTALQGQPSSSQMHAIPAQPFQGLFGSNILAVPWSAVWSVPGTPVGATPGTPASATPGTPAGTTPGAPAGVPNTVKKPVPYWEIEGVKYLIVSAVSTLNSPFFKAATMRTLHAWGVTVDGLRTSSHLNSLALANADDSSVKSGDPIAALVRSGNKICLTVLMVDLFCAGMRSFDALH
jgi:hypothetical protein